MIRYIIVSLVNGILFGTMDGVINANPLAQKMFEVYKPIAKTSINMPAGVIIDIIYGFAIGFVFLLLYNGLPGNNGIIKGIFFGIIIWFFRVLMNVVSNWMMFQIPIPTLLYMAVTGLFEMLILGIIYGLFLKPFSL